MDKIAEKVAAHFIKKIFKVINENREPKFQDENYFIVRESRYTTFVYLLLSMGITGFGVFTFFDGVWEGAELILSFLIVLIGVYLLWMAYFTFSKAAYVSWDAQSIRGRKHLLPIPFRKNTNEIPWQDVVFVGSKLNTWYIQSVSGSRVYWSFMHAL